MSGRFVRASKFRHVHGEAPKKSGAYTDIRPQTTGEGAYIAANPKFFAVGIQGGGGPLLVHPIDQPKRFPPKYPVINVHKAKVLDMDFNPFNMNLVATASDDASVKVTRFPEGGLEKTITDETVALYGHQKRAHSCKFNPVAENVLLSASYDHTVKLWDIEAQQEVISFEEHSELVQSVVWNRDGSQVATTSKDKQIRLFDPRSPDSTNCVSGMEGSKSSKACFLGNTGKLAVCGFSKTSSRKIALYDLRKMEEKASEIEVDSSAGVLLPHFDEDTNILFVGGKGDGFIRYYEITDEAPFIYQLSDFRSSTPQKGICFAPKTACDYMKCEIALAFRVLRDMVEPVHLTVPRKSDLFQDDLFPETFAGVPALSATEWLGGANKDPIKKPINEAAAEAGAVKEFVAKKSAVELEKELEIANSRIAQLEAELAKLKA